MKKRAGSTVSRMLAMLTVIMGATVFPLAPAWSAVDFTLQVTPEIALPEIAVDDSSSDNDVAYTVLTATLDRPVPLTSLGDSQAYVRVNFEIESGPMDRDGSDPMFPDVTCRIYPTTDSCTIKLVGPVSATQTINIIRAWINDPSFYPGDFDHNGMDMEEGRNAGADDCVPDIDSPQSCDGPAEPGIVAEPDLTDVVQVGQVPPRTRDNNSSPEVQDDEATTDEDSLVTIDVLANDTDPDQDAMTVGASGASHGTVVVNEDQTVTYSPDPDFYGDDSFGYQAYDEYGGYSRLAIVRVHVAPVNDLPVAADDSASTMKSTPVDIDVTANDFDVEDGTVRVDSLGTPSSGTAYLLGSGAIRYEPKPGFSGIAEFTYSVVDSSGGSATATVRVSVAKK